MKVPKQKVARYIFLNDPQQCNIIPEVGHGKASVHDDFVDTIFNTVSMDTVSS